MKKTILLLLLITAFQLAIAQISKVDSLKKQLTAAKSDTTKLRLLAELCENTWGRTSDTSMIYEQQLYQLATQLDSTNYKARSFMYTGSAYGVMGDYAKSVLNYYKALKIYRAAHNDQKVASVYINMSIDYIQMQDYPTALFYSQKADTIFRSLPALVKQSAHSKRMERANNANIGECYLFMGKLDLAESYFQKTYRDIAQITDPEIKAYLYRDLGELAKARGKLGEALPDFRNSIVFAKKADDDQAVSIAQLSIATLYQKTGQHDSTVFYANKALLSAQSGNFKQDVLNAIKVLYSDYDNSHNLPQTLKYLKMAAVFKDNLFNQDMTKQLVSADYEEKQGQLEIAAAQERYQSKIRAYAMAIGIVILLLLAVVFWRSSNQRKNANRLLQIQKEEITAALAKLEQTKDQLIQSEKMASLGELTAGIAHEIQNPLNFVNNFAEVSVELLAELKEETEAGHAEEVMAIVGDLTQNLEKIRHHGERANGIVKGMLEHSRASTGEKEQTYLNKLADEYLRLAYHGLRAKDKTFNTSLITHFNENLPPVNIIPQDIGRVLLNVLNNAFYAVQQKAQTAGPLFKPMVELSTAQNGAYIEITVKDNGTGIPVEIRNKIMQPFFTTKPTGQGTGLGLSLSYDIVVKAHRGKIDVQSEEGVYTQFVISVPVINY